MRRLLQRCMSDCYPTCIGMVADLPYAEAIRLVHPFRLKGSDYYTDDDQAIKALRKLGFRVRKRYLKNFSKLKDAAIIVVNFKPEDKNYDGHVVVWDPVSQEVFDPDPESKWVPAFIYEEYVEYVLILT